MSGPVNPLDAPPDRRRRLAGRSAELLRTHQIRVVRDPHRPGFAPYQCSWFRDGSFVAEGAGLHDEADRFHGWCARVLV
nr:hypothetical protein [Nocardioides sp.]